MDADSGQKRDLAAATRGLIVQRVLIEGLSPEEAGKPFGIDERCVKRWIAAYRRQGMASLRENGTPGITPQRWVGFYLARIDAWLRRALKRPAPRLMDGKGATVRRWRRY